MNRTALLLISLGVGLQTLHAQQEQSPKHGQFMGFPKGSWIICTTKVTNQDDTSTSRRKIVLDNTDSEANGIFHDILTIEDSGGDFTGAGSRSSVVTGSPIEEDPNFELVDSRDDHLSLGGQKVPCKQTRFTYHDKDDDTHYAVTQWTTDEHEIPYRVLVIDEYAGLGLLPNVVRIQFEMKSPEHDMVATLAVTKLNARIQVGENEVSCVLEEGEIVYLANESDQRTKIQRWLTNEIPSRVAKGVEKRTTGRNKFERIVTVDEYFITK